MKTIGLIGGMSWESTAHYYAALNKGVKARLGGLNSAQIVMVSVNFHDLEKLQAEGRWQEAAQMLVAAAVNIEAAGADFLLICANTMHKVADEVATAIAIPLLHIADATGEILVRDKRHTVALLGTRFTMQEEFYKDRIAEKFNIKMIVPEPKQIIRVDTIIYDELCQGIVTDSAREEYLNIVNDLAKAGAEAVVLGCTEISMLIDQQHTRVPLYDTTAIHAGAAVNFCLGDVS